MKILGIDDNADINAVFGIALSSAGHEFTSTLSANEGLRLIRANRYDVILLDLAMPEFSGVDLLDAVEKDGLLGRLKIIIITASSVVEKDFERFMKRGVAACLRKPVDLDEFLQKIEEVASRPRSAALA